MSSPTDLYDRLAARLYVSRATAKRWLYECGWHVLGVDPWLRHIVLAEAAEVARELRR